MTENLLSCYHALDLSVSDIVRLVRNGIEAAFIRPEERAQLIARFEQYTASFGTHLLAVR